MREAAFIKQNQKRWQEFERMLTAGKPISPDVFADIFIQLTDDLSFARTQYADSRVTRYLNDLTSKIHLEIYKNKREHRNRFIYFWQYEVPQALYEARKPLLYSFLIFIVSGLLGVVSSLYDDTFVRLILGDFYVNMTIENIKEGNPTGVYQDEDAWDMFLMITFNNVMVSLRAFILGVFTSILTGYILFSNGVMLGAFFILFYQENQLAHAAPVVMLHGTIELSAIVIAGAAGITMGNSILFPGTYSRVASFQRGAKRGIKIILGLTPLFIIAGFVESFVTRYAFMHWSLKAAIIVASATLMIYYFVVYPFRVHKKYGAHIDA